MITLIEDKTYKIKNCGDVSAKIVIGGNNKDKFIPNLNVGYYFGGGEEYYDNLNRTDKITTSKSDLRFDGSKITLIDGGDIDEIYTDGQGRLKWDVVFESCPESMTLEWKRKCSNGLTAHYQDTLENDWLREPMGLSLEEYLATHHRPDEAIGSYAIYCDKAHNYIKPKDKKKEIPANWKALLSDGATLADVNINSYREYKTGKVGHSYRPFVIDANRKKEWCVMLFVGNIVRITLPEEFMKTSKYPVRLDPTIGYSSAGASGWGHVDRIILGRYLCSTDGTANPGTIYAYVTQKTSDNIRGCVYANSGGTASGQTKLSSSESEITIGTTPLWVNGGITVSGGFSASTDYFIGVHCDSCYIGYDTGTGGYNDAEYAGTQTYTPGINSLPETFPYTGQLSRQMSIYIDYTESGGVVANAYYYKQQQ